jgi:hypothetical protein
VLDAFFQAARGGDVDALVALLQPALVNGAAVIADPQRVRRLAAAVLSG